MCSSTDCIACKDCVDPEATPDVDPDADVEPEVDWVRDPEAALAEAAAWLRVPAATPAVPLGRRGGPPAALSLVDMTQKKLCLLTVVIMHVDV